MTDLVSVASNAVAAYQRALGTVSNNIANVATAGYTRETTVLQANPASKIGNIYMGTGVMVDRIQRQYDSFAEANLRNSNSDLKFQEPMVNYANRVIDVMGGKTMGLTSALDQFFSSVRDLSADPASSVVRGSFVRDAQGLASRFGQLSAQLDLVQDETTQAVSSSVGQMNSLIQQLAQVNTQLTGKKTADAQPAALLDQRDSLLRQLSSFAHVNTRFSENGSVLVSLGPSVTQDIVVDGSKATTIGANFNTAAPEKVSLVLDPYGKPSSLSSVSSGTLAGLMAFREQVLGSTRSALDALAGTVMSEINTVHQQGVDAYGNPGGPLFTSDPTATSVAGGMRVAFSDPLMVSAAAQFRVTAGVNNSGGAGATIGYTEVTPTTPSVPLALSTVMVNNPSPSAGVATVLTTSRPFDTMATIPNGQQDVTIFLDGAQPGQQLQLLTRDGRQVIGAPLDATMQTRLLTPDNGFASGATYSSAYLNKSGSTASGDAIGYKGMTSFYGVQASVLQQPAFDSKGVPIASIPVAAKVTGNRLPPNQAIGIMAGVLVMNGTSLGELKPQPGKNLQASDIAAWVNTVSATTGVVAVASNDIRVPASQLKLDMPLTLNGIPIAKPDGGFANSQALVDAINEESAASGVAASISRTGEVVLSNAAGKAGQDIQIEPDIMAGTSVNALGINAGVFTGQVSLTRDLVPGKDTPVQLGFGPNGTPADLAKLGFRTGAYLSGKVPDDLLVVVTGTGSSSVAASFTDQIADPKQALRTQPMKLTFTSATHFTITDSKTNTILAERDFDPALASVGISYQGLQVSFNGAPKAGDSFTMDGNKDGNGNNENMLLMASLESKAVVGNKTMGEAYIDHVNEMGNISHQASIAQSALTVVHDQAVSMRDQVSGVSLDVEAADLIRYQQAYQASAKILQVASQLFDSILQVR